MQLLCEYQKKYFITEEEWYDYSYKLAKIGMTLGLA